ncbi:lysoplasmalogenase family protein [Robertkochia flava]|uniref:lysoplasmalogenase family protein n=1 Tax=Robertkochia flava TaxID=3447986 RepID=UPI001CCF8984|nr:lysoplasmalogenase family protein [Robertkochia marina]
MNKILQWKWYLGAGLLFIIATIAGFDAGRELLLLSLLPLVFAYAYKYKVKFNGLIWMLLISYYTGDILMSGHDPDLVPVMLGIYAVGHLTFLYISYKCIKDLNVKKILFSAIPFIVLWFIYFNYSIKDIFGSQMGDNYPYIMAYSIILSSFMIVALLKFFNDERKEYLFTLIVGVSFVGGDIMMGLYDYVTPARIFEVSHSIATVAAYFFLMRFIIEFDFKQIL